MCLAACEGSCSGKDDAAPTGSTSQKLDVKAACERQAGWKRRTSHKCTHCEAFAKTPKCNCNKDDAVFSGKCAAQQGAINADDACDPTFKCAAKCKPTECDCQAKCFEGAAQHCRDLAEAYDACIIEICEPYCSEDDTGSK
jgi:hypothetical protein